MPRPRVLLLCGVVAALALVATQSLGARTEATFFGAKLDSTSQPANAESGQRCDDNGGIPAGGACTWVSVQAYHNGGRERAPRTGTIGTVKLVSCVAGSFRLQLARVTPGTRRATVVRNGPVIRYGADPRQTDGDEDTFCGGEDGTDYIVQRFPVRVHVNKGDMIAIRAVQTGTLYCSGGSGVLLYSPPLAPGAARRPANDTASCNLLVQLVYR